MPLDQPTPCKYTMVIFMRNGNLVLMSTNTDYKIVSYDNAIRQLALDLGKAWDIEVRPKYISAWTQYINDGSICVIDTD